MNDSSLSSLSEDRFRSVEHLAVRIFDRLPELNELCDRQDPDQISSVEPEDSNVVAFPGGPERSRSYVLKMTEKLLSTLADALEDPTELQEHTREPETRLHHAPSEPDAIDYRSAYRRAKLPEGVEPLTGPSTAPGEAETMAAIRALMDVQEQEVRQEQITRKREKSRVALPPIEPQDGMIPKEPEKTENLPLWLIFAAFFGAAFRSETFLAVSIAGWCTLFMMLAIDSSLSLTLSILSGFMLVVFFCLRAEARTTAAISLDGGAGQPV